MGEAHRGARLSQRSVSYTHLDVYKRQITGRVNFEDVTFSYDPEKVILKNVSFEVEPGQTIALVGPTGAGKSTVVNLISRFYDVQGGAVKIDGYDVRDVQRAALHVVEEMCIRDRRSVVSLGKVGSTSAPSSMVASTPPS